MVSLDLTDDFLSGADEIYGNTLCVCSLGDHVAFSCDVSKEQEVQKTFETIQKTLGNVSYLVNAAGINRWAELKVSSSVHALLCLQKCIYAHVYVNYYNAAIELWTIWLTCVMCVYVLYRCLCLFRDALLLRTKPEDMVALLHTNLLGTMLTCRAALRSMLHTQGAAIVNIGTDSSESTGLHD